ncbi:MAG: erythromycin esterase family protein [Phycisphaerae bacterium]
MLPHIAFDPSPEQSGPRDAAIHELLRNLGNPPMLALGEPLHGSEFLLELRNRLFQRLVASHGFTAIALESSFPRGVLVNRFVLGGDVAVDDALREGFSHEFGKSPANRALIEWMCHHNANHPTKLHFYGADAPTEMMFTDSPRQTLLLALDYLDRIDPAAGAARRAAMQPFFGDDAAWENPRANFEPAQSIGLSATAAALRVETENLHADLMIRRPEAIAATSLGEFEEAMRYAGLARQLLDYHAGVAGNSPTRIADLLALRDVMMADNLLYVLGRERPRGRVLVFAHNMHLKRGNAAWQLGPQLLSWSPAGAHLGRVLGSEYRVIGTGIGRSDSQRLAEPDPGTREQALMALPGPARFVLTPHLPREFSAAPARTTANPGFFPLPAETAADFDAILMLDAIP